MVRSTVYGMKHPPASITMCVLYHYILLQAGRGPSKRGVALQFGPDVTERFCRKNNLGELAWRLEIELHNVGIVDSPLYCMYIK